MTQYRGGDGRTVYQLDDTSRPSMDDRRALPSDTSRVTEPGPDPNDGIPQWQLDHQREIAEGADRMRGMDAWVTQARADPANLWKQPLNEQGEYLDPGVAAEVKRRESFPRWTYGRDEENPVTARARAEDMIGTSVDDVRRADPAFWAAVDRQMPVSEYRPR